VHGEDGEKVVSVTVVETSQIDGGSPSALGKTWVT
jgi:hypothetical protein